MTRAGTFMEGVHLGEYKFVGGGGGGGVCETFRSADICNSYLVSDIFRMGGKFLQVSTSVTIQCVGFSPRHFMIQFSCISLLVT